jgi:hypothetical protein
MPKFILPTAPEQQRGAKVALENDVCGDVTVDAAPFLGFISEAVTARTEAFSVRLEKLKKRLGALCVNAY